MQEVHVSCTYALTYWPSSNWPQRCDGWEKTRIKRETYDKCRPYVITWYLFLSRAMKRCWSLHWLLHVGCHKCHKSNYHAGYRKCTRGNPKTLPPPQALQLELQLVDVARWSSENYLLNSTMKLNQETSDAMHGLSSTAPTWCNGHRPQQSCDHNRRSSTRYQCIA